MKPKYSTGYISPQVKGTKQTPKAVDSGSKGDSGAMSQINNSLYEKIMSCPIKRKLILGLIASEQDNIQEYKKNLEKQKLNDNSASPLKRLQKKPQCESPTALLRRRALEQQNSRTPTGSNSDSCSDKTGSRSSSRQSISVHSPVPFNKLLDGVVAYVEIKSKDQDRSTGVKALTCSMGATIRDTFTRDVTHVIFKDGSFTTYQKANLMNIHLVSVLWLEACKSSGMKVSESKFPALGTDAYDHNVSTICSQMQKEYEEIIKEEYQRSFLTGTPLPTTKSLIDRRRTIMTPKVSTSYSRRKLSLGLPSSQDREVADILSNGCGAGNFWEDPDEEMNASPECTSDDNSDMVALVDGKIISSKKRETPSFLSAQVDVTSEYPQNDDHIINDTMDLTIPAREVDTFSKENVLPINTPDDMYNKKTPKIRSRTAGKSMSARKFHDKSIDTPNVSKRRTNSVKITGSENNDTISEIVSNEEMSSLKLPFSPKVQILSKNISVVSPNMVKSQISSSLSAKEHSSGTTKVAVEKSLSTNMSSLQISEKSTSTNMSTLQISAESENTNKRLSNKKDSERKSTNDKSFNSINSFSPLQQDVVNGLLKLLDDKLETDNITRRKRRVREKVTHYGVNELANISNPKKSATQSIESNIPDEHIGKERRYSCRRTIQPVIPSGKGTEPSPQKSESDSSGSEGNNKNRRARKLYNPNISIDKVELSDEKERENMRLKAKKQKCDEGVFIRPNIIPIKSNVFLSQKAMNFMKTNNLSMKNFLNKKPGGSDSESHDSVDKKKIEKECKTTQEFFDDEQRELAQIVLAEKKALESTHTEHETDIIQDLIRTDKNIQEQTNIVDEINDVDSKTVNTRKNVTTPRKSKTDENNMKTPRNTDRTPEISKSLPKKIKASTKTTPRLKTVSQSVGPQRRCSVRLSQRTIKKMDLNSSSSGEENGLLKLRNRRSSLEFQSKTGSKKKQLKIDKAKKPSIVCTKMKRDDIQIFSQIVRKLGGFVIEDEVTTQTTHLVAGEPKRTINMLRAIANGCWVLKKEWLFKSLEAGKWLPEEDFEESDFSEVVQKSRMQRQAFGPTYSMDVFRDCGPIYVAKDTIPRCSDLRELVTWCRGKDCPNARGASIVVGEPTKHEGATCVTVNWLLDSITFGRKMPFRKYVFEKSRRSITV